MISGLSDPHNTGTICTPVVSPVISAAPEECHEDCTELPEDVPFNDIGALLDPEKSINDIYQGVSKLTSDEKYALLYHHIAPPNVFPTQYLNGNNRKFSISWLEKYPWLLYSPKLDG